MNFEDVIKNGYSTKKLTEIVDADINGLVLVSKTKNIWETSGKELYMICDNKIIKVHNCGAFIDPHGKIFANIWCDDPVFPMLEGDIWSEHTIEVSDETFDSIMFLNHNDAYCALKKMEN